MLDNHIARKRRGKWQNGLDLSDAKLSAKSAVQGPLLVLKACRTLPVAGMWRFGGPPMMIDEHFRIVVRGSDVMYIDCGASAEG